MDKENGKQRQYESYNNEIQLSNELSE